MPTAFSPTNSFTASGDLSKTTHRWRFFRSRRTMFAPILPRPIIPSSMLTPFFHNRLLDLSKLFVIYSSFVGAHSFAEQTFYQSVS